MNISVLALPNCFNELTPNLRYFAANSPPVAAKIGKPPAAKVFPNIEAAPLSIPDANFLPESSPCPNKSEFGFTSFKRVSEAVLANLTNGPSKGAPNADAAS